MRYLRAPPKPEFIPTGVLNEMDLNVRVCRSCVERARTDFLYDLGNRMCGLLKRELAKDGLTGSVNVAELTCFRDCPPNGITTTLAPRDKPWRAERRTVETFADLETLYQRILDAAE
jgi:hypothetical protein